MDPLQYIRVLAEDNSKAKNIYSRSVTLAEELGRVGGAKRNSVSQRQIPYDFTHVWNLRSKTNEESGKERERERETRKQPLLCRGQTDGYQKGGG